MQDDSRNPGFNVDLEWGYAYRYTCERVGKVCSNCNGEGCNSCSGLGYDKEVD